MATSRRLLQISKSNRIIREAVEEKREEKCVREGRKAGVSTQESETRKNLYTEDTESIWIDDGEDGLEALHSLLLLYSRTLPAWWNPSTSPKHLSLNLVVITTITGAKRRAWRLEGNYGRNTCRQTWRWSVEYIYIYIYIYRVIKKSLCTWRLQYSTIDDLKMVITEYIRNADRAIVNTVFENTVRRVNIWRLAGGTLNITCNFLYCNHQVHRDFLITLYIYIYTHTVVLYIYIYTHTHTHTQSQPIYIYIDIQSNNFLLMN
jgi:hypothetical protein